MISGRAKHSSKRDDKFLNSSGIRQGDGFISCFEIGSKGFGKRFEILREEREELKMFSYLSFWKRVQFYFTEDEVDKYKVSGVY